MGRIEKQFASLRASQRTALIPFITAGDPAPDFTVGMMHAMVEAGADIIELGVPFSDPMADGPVIQRASERALKHHTSLHDVIGMVAQFRQKDTTTPVVLMGYLNPIEIMGYREFAAAAAGAGVDGVLTVDLPPEEADEFIQIARENAIDPIFLLAPTTTDARIDRICAAASGFVYYVSIKGVTGAKHLDTAEVASKLNQIRKKTALPLGVGFGIKDADTAARIAEIADAVVVGSALVSQFEQHEQEPSKITTGVTTLLAAMRAAMDSRAQVATGGAQG